MTRLNLSVASKDWGRAPGASACDSSVVLFETASRETIDEVQASLGFELSLAVLNRYEEATEIILHCAPEGSEEAEALGCDVFDGGGTEASISDVPYDHDAFVWSPLEDWISVPQGDTIFPDSFAREETVIGEETYDGGEFPSSIRIVDLFVGDNYPVGVSLVGKEPEPTIVVGSDCGAAFDEYAPLSFWSYLEFELRTYASAHARMDRLLLADMDDGNDPDELDYEEVPDLN